MLRRWLRASGFQLDHVMNITDVDDKIIRNAVAQHKSLEEYTAHLHAGVSAKIAQLLRLETPERAGAAPPSTSTDMAHAIEQTGRERLHLRERRLGLFPHRDISRNTASCRTTISAAFAPARAWMWTSTTRPTRAISRLWKAPKEGEPFWDTPIGPRPPRLAHRMLRDGDQVSGRDAGYSRRRRRPDLPASRERDRAIGSAHRQAVRALLAACRVSDGGRAEDVEVAGQLSITLRDIAGQGLSAGSGALSAGVGALSQDS